MQGYVPADGTGKNGVLVVLEAAGADEEASGLPTVGAAGHYLWSNLRRVGLEREEFRIHNVLSCRPPGNKLADMPYEKMAIDHCRANLDQTIAAHRRDSLARGLSPVILTLGKIAFKRVMGLDDRHPMMRYDYQCYPHWNQHYACWVIAADHPSYLMRGNNHLLPVLQFAAQRAVEVAADPNFRLDAPAYILDPSPSTFRNWIAEFRKVWESDPEGTFLSYDIETPYKTKVEAEDDLDKSESDDDSWTILRCSLSYRTGSGLSAVWNSENMGCWEEVFGIPCIKTGWNLAYDSPRVRNQVRIAGYEVDAMLAWHILNSALPKALGFVTPFYVKNAPMWKHLSDAQPAYYNAADANYTLANFLGIREDLIKNGQWDIFNRHVLELNKALAYMQDQGVLLDAAARRDAEVKLQGLLDSVKAKMEAAVPIQVRSLKVYKKPQSPLKASLRSAVK